jgi:hypothetical protein
MPARIRLTKYQCQELAKSITRELKELFEQKRNAIYDEAEAVFRKTSDGRMIAHLMRKYPEDRYGLERFVRNHTQKQLDRWKNPMVQPGLFDRVTRRVVQLSLELDTYEAISTTIRKEELRKLTKRQRSKFGVRIA